MTDLYLPAEERREILRAYGHIHELGTFIETGTSDGGTTWALREEFQFLHTIEVDPYLYKQACDRFAPFLNITCWHGDSGKLLPEILELVYGPALVWLDGHWCTDHETEILTKRGWLSWDEVQVGDFTLAIDPVTRLSGWQPISGVYRAPVCGEPMVAMKGRSFDALVTPQHKWLVTSWHDSPYELVSTDQLRGMHQIPLSAPRSDLPIDAVVDDAFVELIGWWMTEGTNSRGSIVIGQSPTANPEKVDRIRSAFVKKYGQPGQKATGPFDWSSYERVIALRQGGRSMRSISMELGIGYRTVMYWVKGKRRPVQFPALWSESQQAQGSGCVLFSLGRQASAEILAVAPQKIPTMEWLCLLTKHQLDLLIETLIDGDGSRSSKRGRNGARTSYVQADLGRTKAFEVICVLAGKAVRTVEMSPSSPKSKKPQWRTVIRVAERTAPIKAHNIATSSGMSVETVPYDGVVWCPTVRHGNWLARRNGSIYFTGNCSPRHNPNGPDSPIQGELAALFADGRPHIILIDDARLFRGGLDWESERYDWPSLTWVQEVAQIHGYDYELKDDVIRLVPRDL